MLVDQILESAKSQDIFEWIGLLSGIVYVFLAARENMLCWFFGIISCSLIAYKDMSDYKLYSDAFLQFFYVLMGFWGLYTWRKSKSSQNSEMSIRRWPLKNHLVMILVLSIIAYPIGWLMTNYTDANFSFLDALTTVFSIFATFLLVKKYVGNWVYWIIIDIAYIYIYGQGGGPLFAFLSLLYACIAVYGFWNWRRSQIKAATEVM